MTQLVTRTAKTANGTVRFPRKTSLLTLVSRSSPGRRQKLPAPSCIHSHGHIVISVSLTVAAMLNMKSSRSRNLLVNLAVPELAGGRMLLASPTFGVDWQAALHFHGAVLLEIERGLLSWGDLFLHLESRIWYGYFNSTKPSVSASSSASMRAGSVLPGL